MITGEAGGLVGVHGDVKLIRKDRSEIQGQKNCSIAVLAGGPVPRYQRWKVSFPFSMIVALI